MMPAKPRSIARSAYSAGSPVAWRHNGVCMWGSYINRWVVVGVFTSACLVMRLVQIRRLLQLQRQPRGPEQFGSRGSAGRLARCDFVEEGVENAGGIVGRAIDGFHSRGSVRGDCQLSVL